MHLLIISESAYWFVDVGLVGFQNNKKIHALIKIVNGT